MNLLARRIQALITKNDLSAKDFAKPILELFEYRLIVRENETILDIDEDLAGYCFQILSISVIRNSKRVESSIIRQVVKIGIALTEVNISERERLEAQVCAALIDLLAFYESRSFRKNSDEIVEKCQGTITRVIEKQIFLDYGEKEESFAVIEENRRLLSACLFNACRTKNAEMAATFFQYFGDCRQEYNEVLKFARQKMEQKMLSVVMLYALQRIFSKSLTGQSQAENIDNANGKCTVHDEFFLEKLISTSDFDFSAHPFPEFSFVRFKDIFL